MNPYEFINVLVALALEDADYGYVPETLAEDGDPLDVMVCVSEPTFRGCSIAVKVIALLRMRDENGLDDKIVCVPCEDPSWNHIDRLEELRQQPRDEITHFLPVAAVLVTAGVLLADEAGALGVVGPGALAQGISLAVALPWLAAGHNTPPRR